MRKKESRKNLSFEERIVAKCIGDITGKNGKGIDLIRADGETIREEWVQCHNKVKRVLSVNIFEVARHVILNETDVFNTREKIIQTIFRLIHKNVVDVSKFHIPLFQMDDGKDPNNGSYQYGNPEIFVFLPSDYY